MPPKCHKRWWFSCTFEHKQAQDPFLWHSLAFHCLFCRMSGFRGAGPGVETPILRPKPRPCPVWINQVSDNLWKANIFQSLSEPGPFEVAPPSLHDTLSELFLHSQDIRRSRGGYYYELHGSYSFRNNYEDLIKRNRLPCNELLSHIHTQ